MLDKGPIDKLQIQNKLQTQDKLQMQDRGTSKLVIECKPIKQFHLILDNLTEGNPVLKSNKVDYQSNE